MKPKLLPFPNQQRQSSEGLGTFGRRICYLQWE